MLVLQQGPCLAFLLCLGLSLHWALRPGIAASSTAAAWMSSAALANGAGVTAGSTVALFQSIGAAGLSAKAMTALGAGGAVIGSGTAATFTSTWDYCRQKWARK